jgi:hypothetical protein
VTLFNLGLPAAHTVQVIATSVTQNIET